jgi:hypothetical protein
MAKSTVPPVIIDIVTGAGVPGVFNGLDYRLGIQAAAEEVKKILDKVDFTDENKAKSDIKKLSQEEGQKMAKGAGCGSRRAKAKYIYSASVAPDSASADRWDRKIAILSASGFVEKDALKPTNVSDDDWRQSVADFSSFADQKDVVDQNNSVALKSMSSEPTQSIPIRYTYFTLPK